MNKVQEALKKALARFQMIDQGQAVFVRDAIDECKSALSDIEKCEPVAEALHERNRLGYAVVDVIGTLDEIIENAQEVEVDDFLHIAIPIDKWHELQDALEEMPKRADLYTSPQPIEKCEPVAWMNNDNNEVITKYKKAEHPYPNFDTPLYTSPQKQQWVGLSNEDLSDCWNFTTREYEPKLIEAKLKQLNTKG